MSFDALLKEFTVMLSSSRRDLAMGVWAFGGISQYYVQGTKKVT